MLFCVSLCIVFCFSSIISQKSTREHIKEIHEMLARAERYQVSDFLMIAIQTRLSFEHFLVDRIALLMFAKGSTGQLKY